jgi:uncharacterized membrane protein
METQQYHPAPPTNSKAVASMVLGILAIIPWLGFVLGIIGIILASKAFKEIDATAQSGRGMAVAGLVTSIVWTALYGILLLFTLFGYLLLSLRIY